MTGRSYIDVLQVQGVQVLIVSLPENGRPPFPRDGTGQHGALADRRRGDAHSLVVRKAEQVDVCGREGEEQMLERRDRTLIQRRRKWPQLHLLVKLDGLLCQVTAHDSESLTHRGDTSRLKNVMSRSHLSLLMMPENKSTKYKSVSISRRCAGEAFLDVGLVKDALRRHDYCNPQSNGLELSLMFCKYFA